ncbi:predicted protein [Naegleria gruberi]|uniref:Predicted protein n=1 Tax=Naegleria gruberi TaxID=5762 RepID=D2VS79_NAEGR|nr:uncharacterized protein NAEGRDRAFT_71843 [Naegleria gruberi]EFC40378.1 predicted protein [Naegleria gruberi]|eukprot:XP_002673122.1 predicted protein [Naegleria gruberi strain NEG-M]
MSRNGALFDTVEQKQRNTSSSSLEQTPLQKYQFLYKGRNIDDVDEEFQKQKALFSRVGEKFDFDLHQSIDDLSLSEDDGMSNEEDDGMEKRSFHEDDEEPDENNQPMWNIITAEDQSKQKSPKEKHVHYHHFLDMIDNNDKERESMLEALGVIEQSDGNFVSDAASYVEDEERSEIAKFIEQYCSFTESNSQTKSKEKSPENSRVGKSMLNLSYGSDDGLKKSGKVQIIPKSPSHNVSHLSNVSSIAETSEQLKQIDSMISKLLQGNSPEKKIDSYSSPQYNNQRSTNFKSESSINLLNQYTSPMKSSPTKQLEKKTLTKPVPFSFSLDKRKRNLDKSLEDDSKKMAECTFHPNISKYNSAIIETESFVERASRWKEKVEQDKKTMEKALQDSLKKDCSFKPEINPISLRKLDEEVGVYDRLYVDSFRVMDKIDENRYKLSEDEFRKTCTFKPKIKSSNAQPKYLEPKKPIEKKKDESIDYTFKPNTLDPKVSHQSSIKYLSEDPFLRLSRRLASDDTVIKRKNQNKESRPKSAGKYRPTGNFEEFLKRQNQTLSKKEEKIDFIRQTEFSYKPALNNKSMEIFHGLDQEKRNEILKHRKKIVSLFFNFF